MVMVLFSLPKKAFKHQDGHLDVHPDVHLDVQFIVVIVLGLCESHFLVTFLGLLL